MWCRAVTMPVAPACRASDRVTTSSGPNQRQVCSMEPSSRSGVEGELDLHGPLGVLLHKVEGRTGFLAGEGWGDSGARFQAAPLQPLHHLRQEVPVEPGADQGQLLLHDL